MSLIRKISDYAIRLREMTTDHRIDARYFLNPKTIKNTLLILKLDSIGDYIIFRNFLEEIGNNVKYKDYKITLCGNIWWKDLAEKLDQNFIDEFIWVDYHKLYDFSYMLKLNKRLYSKGFEVAMDPTFSRTKNADTVMLRSGAKIKITQFGEDTNIDKALKKMNDSKFSELISIDQRYGFEFYRYKLFFEKFLNKKIELKRPIIPFKASSNKFIIIAPGAKNPIRQWSPDNFYAISKLLKQYNFPESRFVVVGSQQEQHLYDSIVSCGKDVVFENKMGVFSLTDLLECMVGADLIIANDSAPFHMAVALNKKVVSISNGNNFQRFSPYPAAMDTQSVTVYSEKVENMMKNEKAVIQFQTIESAENVNDVSVEKVYEAIKTLIK